MENIKIPKEIVSNNIRMHNNNSEYRIDLDELIISLMHEVDFNISIQKLTSVIFIDLCCIIDISAPLIAELALTDPTLFFSIDQIVEQIIAHNVVNVIDMPLILDVLIEHKLFIFRTFGLLVKNSLLALDSSAELLVYVESMNYLINLDIFTPQIEKIMFKICDDNNINRLLEIWPIDYFIDQMSSNNFIYYSEIFLILCQKKLLSNEECKNILIICTSYVNEILNHQNEDIIIMKYLFRFIVESHNNGITIEIENISHISEYFQNFVASDKISFLNLVFVFFECSSEIEVFIFIFNNINIEDHTSMIIDITLEWINDVISRDLDNSTLLDKLSEIVSAGSENSQLFNAIQDHIDGLFH